MLKLLGKEAALEVPCARGHAAKGILARLALRDPRVAWSGAPVEEVPTSLIAELLEALPDGRDLLANAMVEQVAKERVVVELLAPEEALHPEAPACVHREGGEEPLDGVVEEDDELRRRRKAAEGRHALRDLRVP